MSGSEERCHMVLEARDIHKSFGAKRVLNGLSFTAREGKAFGLLGRNGAGKTTALRIIMSVFPADSGEVLSDGTVGLDPRRVGYMPEERGLYPKKKIIDQLVYFARLKGMSTADAVAAADNWLGRLGMSEYRDKRLDTLSKGNQQKIQLITALAHDPEVIILDEPFSGLDPVNAALLEDVVRDELCRGKTVIFSSHQMNYIEEFCDSIVILNGGMAAVSGRLHDIKRSYTRDRLVVRSERAEEIAEEFGERCFEKDTGELIVLMNSPDDKRRMMSYLTEKYDIDDIAVYEPSLNDIFVQYAGESAKPE